MRLVMVLIAVQRIMASEVAGGAFVVAGEAAVGGEPGQRAFDAPAARNDGEAVLAFGFAYDVHHGGEDGAGPVDELAGEAAVGEDEPDRADQVRREQGGLGAVTVLHARGQHDDHDEQAQGVGDDEPLPAVDLLAGVVTTAVASDGVRALDALRVDDPGAGLGLAALLHPGLLPQRGQHHLGDLGLLPLLEIPVHGLPRREVSRQVPPGAASPHHVQDPVHNGPAWMLLRPAASPRRRQQRLNQRPLLVGQVRGVPPLPRHPATLMASTFMVTQTRRPRSKNFSNTL
jgi:hypothetical protein